MPQVTEAEESKSKTSLMSQLRPGRGSGGGSESFLKLLSWGSRGTKPLAVNQFVFKYL